MIAEDRQRKAAIAGASQASGLDLAPTNIAESNHHATERSDSEGIRLRHGTKWNHRRSPTFVWESERMTDQGREVQSVEGDTGETCNKESATPPTK